MRNGICMVGLDNKRSLSSTNTKEYMYKYEPIISDQIAQVFKQRDMSIFNNVNVREVKRINNNIKQENGSSVQICWMTAILL